jgi:hypothetical protein
MQQGVIKTQCFMRTTPATKTTPNTASKMMMYTKISEAAYRVRDI